MAETGYTDDNIRTLEGIVHIRKRPGMYIGRLGNGDNPGDGIYVLLKEIIDNSIDEFSMGFGKQIIINVEGRSVSVRDFGRGIPLGSVVKATSVLNTGGKFDTGAFQKSVGLNGVGSKAVNALSEDFYVESYRDGMSSFAHYAKGELLESGQRPSTEKNGTLVRYSADPEMFTDDCAYNMDYVTTMIKNYAYLKKGLTLNLNGTPFKSENGLLDLINDTMTEEPLYPPIHLEGEDIEIVLTHGNSYGENILSFVNGQNTRDGGTHLAAYREAIAKTIKEFFKKEYAPEDIRQGVVGAISIQIQEPHFESQTKIKLGSTYVWEKAASGSEPATHGQTIRSFVNDFVKINLDNYLHIHKEIGPVMQEKIAASEAERKEIAGIQKKGKDKGKRRNVFNRKLRECRIHYNDKLSKSRQDEVELTSIFITEGDSASGTITKVRNAENQAVFSLRGKPINCYKESRVKVAANEELNLLIDALGVEDDMDNLRYNNIIVATDADDDGMHIRMLVLTFFLKYYPDLIRRGHVYILQTPLFRVRNKKETRYCYSVEEKEKAIRSLSKGRKAASAEEEEAAAKAKGVEVTRFKGLGEIDSAEFVHFIGEDMRLDPVQLSDEENILDLMEFYMGDNTPDRQNFIRHNLRSEEELEDVNI